MSTLAILETENTQELEVINLHGIDDSVEGIATGEIPGFQLLPGTEPILAHIALERAMRQHIPQFTFNATTDIAENAARDSGPHVDFGVEGVALHVCRAGEGRVFLASLVPNKYIGAVGGVIADQNDVGPTFAGELTPGMLTVFSESFITNLGRSIGHTYHRFVSKNGNHSRSWVRHAYTPTSSSLRY